MNTTNNTEVYVLCDVSLGSKLRELSWDRKWMRVMMDYVDPLYPLHSSDGEFIGEFPAIMSKEGMDILNQYGLGATITSTRLFGKTWATLV